MSQQVNYQGYFIYKGTVYGVGTEVLFKEEVHKRPFTNHVLIVKPHIFDWGGTDGRFVFKRIEYDKYGKERISNTTIRNPDEEIAEIVNPVYVELVPWQKKAFENMVSGKVHADVFGGILIYIIAMIVGAIFYARWTIWIFATVVFLYWLLNQFRTN